jgi:acetyl esterase/lipase
VSSLLRVLAACLVTGCAVLAAAPANRVQIRPQVIWRLDNVNRIGGHVVTVLGSPTIVPTDIGAVLEFDGVDDGLLIEANPLAGLAQFTIDVVFQPLPGGAEEQRFLHIEEQGSGNRALVELRTLPDARWTLDTYLRSGADGLTLLDRALAHAMDRWHVATLTYDGRTMTHSIDGVRELSGDTRFAPLAAGKTSIGVRQNQVSWFRGRIHSVRMSPQARPQAVALWPEGVPNAQSNGGDERVEDGRVYNVQSPSLIYVPPAATPNGTAVIVCPGGGYARLAIANEAVGVAQRLRLEGVATFILKYRLREYGYPAPLQDVLRAVRLLRSRADLYGISPDRIGVMGASAGGHLAAAAATLFDAAEGRTGNALDGVSARPDFVALLYPVITMQPPVAHSESRVNLIGEHPTSALVQRLSLDAQVRRDMPPVFIAHTSEDASVPLENSLRFYEALRRAGVPAELHLYERGPHGFGVRADLGTTSGWIDRWIEWMRAEGLSPRPDRNRP